MSSGPFTAIGVDIGGTKIAAGRVRFPEGSVEKQLVIPTGDGREAVKLLNAVEELIHALSAAPSDAIGIGICEIVNHEGRLASDNCIPWLGIELASHFGRIAPTVIEADVRAAALAEALFGAGRGARIFLYVTIGTGISSCLVIDGKPFAGSRGASGTMASGIMPRWRGEDRSGSDLTLEEIASGPALVARFRSKGGTAQSGQEVLAAATAGDEAARDVIESAAEALGGSVGWLVNVLDPELVILGGGLGTCEGLYRDTLVASARRHIWWERHRDLPIVSALTGTNAGIIGAAASAWRAVRADLPTGL